MITKNQTDQLRKELLQQREQFVQQLHLDEGPLNQDSERDSVGELSLYDNHPADMGTELFEREKDLAIDEHAEEELEKVNKALKAMDEGTYGQCIVCHQDIPYERLEIVPYTLYCVDHTPDQSMNEYRPVEEEVLEPPHDNTYTKRRQDETRDYQDSFQEVGRFGTSETPSDFNGDYNSYEHLYQDGDFDREGFTENYETFTATDIEGKDRKVMPSRKHEEYEKQLDDQGTEAPFGDVPYHYRDSYVDDDKE
ncbi:molecular chaperone DnaK [Bacillus coahuilensis m2-6]|uniref:TraR/DksA C4-type zinc finger protein n=1 Tax=Bacillus coahuilensis TaxID=408580 RepID=UPI0001851113|nr:TraR/DksA C4-type zinc finger protein [Bacillus coahuilensis]KUP06355.1 molecular chaperone DnaK [Bacillus coahuilensis m2-6]